MARLRRRLALPAALPMAFLLLALSTVFLSGNEWGQIYRGAYHAIVTAHHMAVVENLSPKHHFLGIYRLTLDADGDPSYEPYNRFPIGGYALLKLVILPFEGDISASIHSARILMLAFFIGAAILAWLALCRIMDDRWIALTATLLSFSSFWLLYFKDMVTTETMPDLFGVMLAFHGMVVFVQEGRFRQLLVKTCAALLLGWHVYALLLPFIVFGLARELFRSQPLFRPGRSDRVWAVARTSGRYLLLGAAALLFGAALLSFNFGSEYLAFGGKIPLTELPSVVSMLRRTGWSDYFHQQPQFANSLAWPVFLEGQIRRLGVAMLPFALIEPIWGPLEARMMESGEWSMEDHMQGVFTWGIACGGVCLMALPFVRHGMLLATLAVSGFCWALLMRGNTAFFFHAYEAMFYVGVPLTFFSLICLCIRRSAGGRFVFVLAAAALPVFILSSAKMDSFGYSRTNYEAELMRDFQTIRDVLEQGVVYVPQGQGDRGRSRVRHYLAGSVVLLPGQVRYREKAGFLLMRRRDEGPALLTPDNRHMFLYDRALYDASYDAQALGDPIIASDWSVHFKDGRLIWVSEPCANREARFFLSVVPREAEGLPEHVSRRRVRRMEFGFQDFARIEHRRCVAALDVPEYGLASIRTGQVGEEGLLWEGEHDFGR